MSYFPTRKRLFTPAIIETNQSADLRAHSELAGMSDGSRWVEVGSDAMPIALSWGSALVYNSRLWSIGGSTGVRSRKVYYSIDGITWTEAGVDALPVGITNHASVVYNGKMWMIGGYPGGDSRKVYYSTDGATWTQAGVDALPIGIYYHRCTVYGGRMWVIGGESGGTVQRKVYYSIDGITWTQAGVDALPVATENFVCLVYNGKMWVIGGQSPGVIRSVYYSTDGATWTLASATALPAPGVFTMAGAVYNGKMWVIGGNNGGGATQKVYSSSDGVTWTEAGTNALPVTTRFNEALVFNGKMWTLQDGTRKVYSTVPQTSGMILDGPITHKRTSTGINYTVLGPDHYIGCTAGGITITLPAVANMSGRVIVVKDESGAAAATPIIVQASGAELIDGINTYTLTSNFQSVTLIGTGTSWKIA
jgi:hypothetical protein